MRQHTKHVITVAFLQKLPDMTPAQYKDMVAKAPPDEDMGDENAHSASDAQGMDMRGQAPHSHGPARPPPRQPNHS